MRSRWQIDPEMMTFDKDRKVLIVSGAVSGTLGVYEVGGLPPCPPSNNTNTTALSSAPKLSAASAFALYSSAALDSLVGLACGQAY